MTVVNVRITLDRTIDNARRRPVKPGYPESADSSIPE